MHPVISWLCWPSSAPHHHYNSPLYITMIVYALHLLVMLCHNVQSSTRVPSCVTAHICSCTCIFSSTVADFCPWLMFLLEGPRHTHEMHVVYTESSVARVVISALPVTNMGVREQGILTSTLFAGHWSIGPWLLLQLPTGPAIMLKVFLCGMFPSTAARALST